MTFSLVARCPDTGMFGVAIASSSPAVAARCAYARAGVGAVASQNVTDPTLGPLALDLMEQGANAGAAMAEVKRRGRFIEYRQVLAVDKDGSTAIHSGPNALGIWAEAQEPNVASGGNLLANDAGAAGHRRRVPWLVRPSRRSADRRNARRTCRRWRGRPGAFRRPQARGHGQLAGRRSALRLDRSLSDRGPGDDLGHLQAAAGSLRPARPRSPRGALVRRPRR